MVSHGSPTQNRCIALCADTVQPAAQATRQLTLDAGDDTVLAVEAMADFARARFGPEDFKSSETVVTL